MGDALLHHVGSQSLVDPIYTVAKLKYPYPVKGRLPNPEQPYRVSVCYEALAAHNLLEKCLLAEPKPVSLADLSLVHIPEYIEQVRQLSAAGGGELGESTYIGQGSYEIALLGAGAAIEAAELIHSGKTYSAFVLARPPGHHAKADRAAGFCIFNNVAILAKVCQQRLGWPKVLIIDWDLHHGDGTQAIFYDQADVLFCSLHQFGFELYPETGDFHETGVGAGQGYNVNIPLPAKTSATDYLAIFKEVVSRLAAQFQPNIILVSAGYDCHFNDTHNLYVWDPDGGFHLLAQTYSELTRIVADVAHQYCEGRYLLVLEGGYNLSNLANSVVDTVAAMLGETAPIVEKLPTNLINATLDVDTYLSKLYL